MVSEVSVFTFRNNMPRNINNTDVVLIDTHNFTTTSIEALDNGATEIVPLTSIKGGVPNRITVLAGDENKSVENHPKYMTKERVENEIIGINSWNGSSAVHEIRGVIKDNSVDVYLGSLTNAFSLANHLCNSTDITFILAGSGGNIPPEDTLTMQCIYQCMCINKNNLNTLRSIYKQYYDMLVLNIYDAIYEDYDSLGIFGRPNKHAVLFASQIGSKKTIPIMNNNGGFIKKDF